MVGGWWAVLAAAVLVAATGAIPAVDTEYDPSKPIPRLLHHIWTAEEDPPAALMEVANTCVAALGEDWQYKLWTNDDVDELVSASFPWFSRTYRSMARPSDRARAARYFVMDRFGGFYTDLDVSCNASLEIVLDRATAIEAHVILGNDAARPGVVHDFVAASVPGHRLWRLLESKLARAGPTDDSTAILPATIAAHPQNDLLVLAAPQPAVGCVTMLCQHTGRWGAGDQAYPATTTAAAQGVEVALKMSGFPAAYDRGVDVVMDAWPAVRKGLATLCDTDVTSVNLLATATGGVALDASEGLRELVAPSATPAAGRAAIIMQARIEAPAAFLTGMAAHLRDANRHSRLAQLTGLPRVALSAPPTVTLGGSSAIASPLATANAGAERLAHQLIGVSQATTTAQGGGGADESTTMFGSAVVPSTTTDTSDAVVAPANGGSSPTVGAGCTRPDWSDFPGFADNCTETTAVGGQCTITCTEGYTGPITSLTNFSAWMTGTHVDAVITCNETGNWVDEQDVVCVSTEEMQTIMDRMGGPVCGAPLLPPGISSNCATSTIVGHQCDLFCAAGYRGRSMAAAFTLLTCRDDTQWTVEGEIDCLLSDHTFFTGVASPTECAAPHELGMAHDCAPGGPLGTQCRMECLPGYTLIGSTGATESHVDSTCSAPIGADANAMYSPTGSCVSAQCHSVELAQFPSSVFWCSGAQDVGSLCRLACPANHVGLPTVATCTGTGGRGGVSAAAHWTGTPPSCVAVADAGPKLPCLVVTAHPGTAAAALSHLKAAAETREGAGVLLQAGHRHRRHTRSHHHKKKGAQVQAGKTAAVAPKAVPRLAQQEQAVAGDEDEADEDSTTDSEEDDGQADEDAQAAAADVYTNASLPAPSPAARPTRNDATMPVALELSPMFAPAVMTYALVVPNRYSVIQLSVACDNILANPNITSVDFNTTAGSAYDLSAGSDVVTTVTPLGPHRAAVQLREGSQRLLVTVAGTDAFDLSQYVVVVYREPPANLTVDEYGRTTVHGTIRLDGVEYTPDWQASHGQSVELGLAHSLGFAHNNRLSGAGDGAPETQAVVITGVFPGSVVVEFSVTCDAADVASIMAAFDRILADDTLKNTLCQVASVCATAVSAPRPLSPPHTRVLRPTTPTPTPTPDVPASGTPTPTPTAAAPTPTPTPDQHPDRCQTADGKQCVQAFAESACNEDNLRQSGKDHLCVGYEICQHLALVDGICEQFPVLKSTIPAPQWENCSTPEARKCVEHMVEGKCAAPVHDVPCNKYVTCQRLYRENPFGWCAPFVNWQMVRPTTDLVSLYLHLQLFWLMFGFFGAAPMFV